MTQKTGTPMTLQRIPKGKRAKRRKSAKAKRRVRQVWEAKYNAILASSPDIETAQRTFRAWAASQKI